MLVYPGFGAEILQVDPARDALLPAKCLQYRLGQVAGEGLYQEIAPEDQRDVVLRHTLRERPASQAHTLALPLSPGRRCAAQKGRHHGGIIHPERDLDAVFARKLSGQSPAHTDIPEIVDDGAENRTPEWAGTGSMRSGAM